MPKPSLVKILCEDLQHRVFADRLLKRLGYARHNVRAIPSPAGRGAATAFVIRRYLEAIQTMRSRAGRAETALLVLIDADDNSVDQRMAELQACLAANGIADRTPAERVAILIPRRNIETWIEWFESGSAVDETVGYRKRTRDEASCHPCADKLAELFGQHKQLPEAAPDSLVRAMNELERPRY